MCVGDCVLQLRHAIGIPEGPGAGEMRGLRGQTDLHLKPSPPLLAVCLGWGPLLPQFPYL